MSGYREPTGIPAPLVAHALTRYMREHTTNLAEMADVVAERTGRRAATVERWMRQTVRGQVRAVSLWTADDVFTALDLSLPLERCPRH